MKWLRFIGWTYLVFVLHSGFAREMAIGGCAPHLILAGLVLMILRTTGREAVALAAVWGLLSDCLVDGRLGADVLSFVLAAFALRQSSMRWNLRSPWRSGAISVVIVWGEFVASGSFRMLAEGQSPDFAALALSGPGPAVYTGLLVAGISLSARYVWGNPIDDDAAAVPAVSNKWRMLTE
jgi:rod shape-determining protein MreD